MSQHTINTVMLIEMAILGGEVGIFLGWLITKNFPQYFHMF